MGDFKPLEIFKCPTVGPKTTDDTVHWKQLGFPISCKEYGAVDYVDISLQEPYKMAVTCSSKVHIYSSVENKVQSTLSRFSMAAYGGSFRKDGKLLVAGSEDSFIRLFEVQSSKPLRIFKGHKAAVHRCYFTTTGVQMASFSDDNSVRLWDVATESKLLHLSEHSDYVRAGATNESSDSIILSGSYDHTVKMYDTRTASSVLTVDHGAPVESVLMFPTGGVFLSAGGNYVKVWDRVAGRLLAQVMQHHKTVTSLCFASEGRRLMSGSLDKHVKIYDVMSYDVVHTLTYPSAILSVGCAPEDKIVCVGMTDGLFSIRHMEQPKTQEPIDRKHRKKLPFQHRLYGTDFQPAEGDVVVPNSQLRTMKDYDKHLRRFESSRALDAVLKPHIQKNRPETTVSVMMELIRRGALKSAMAGREGPTLLPLLKFVGKYISDPRFTRIMVDVALMLAELYSCKLGDPTTRRMFETLWKAANAELSYMKDVMEVQGIMKCILAVAHSNRGIQPDSSPQKTVNKV